MGKIRWDYDPQASLQVGYHIDPVTDRVTIVHREDVSPVLKANKRAQLVDVNKPAGDEFWRHVGRIPPGVVMLWMKKYGVDVMKTSHQPKVLQMLDRPEWRWLKVRQGNYARAPERQYFTMTTAARRAASLIGKSSKPGAPVAYGGLGG